MTTTAIDASTTVRVQREPTPRWKPYITEAKYEVVKQLRLPAYLFPALGFPILFYLFFGIVLPPKSSSAAAATYLVATFGAYGVIGIALFGIGIGLATERGQGWLTVKRASPMPLSAYFFAKYCVAVLLGGTVMALLFVVAALFGHVRLAPEVWIELFAAEVLGGIPFCALGITIGYLAGPNSAAGIINGIYLPMAFLSGLLLPITMLPHALQSFAQFLPPYHLARLALVTIGAVPRAELMKSVLALIGFGVLFTVTAVMAYRRDEGKTYG